MPPPSFWSRIRSGQLIQVLVIDLGASWVLLQVVNELSAALSLPDWVSPVAVILLLIGLLIILATAWVQSHPLVDVRAQQEEVPDSWELDLEFFVATWGNADPEAQPMVEDAKQRLADPRIG